MASEPGYENWHFSRSTLVVFVPMVTLAAFVIAILLLPSNPLGSGVVLAAGAVMDGAMARRISGRRAQVTCYLVAVLCVAFGILLQSIVPPA